MFLVFKNQQLSVYQVFFGVFVVYYNDHIASCEIVYTLPFYIILFSSLLLTSALYFINLLIKL